MKFLVLNGKLLCVATKNICITYKDFCISIVVRLHIEIYNLAN